MREWTVDQELEWLQKKAKTRFIIWGICLAVIFVLVLIGVWRFMAGDDHAIYMRIFAAIAAAVTVSGFLGALLYALLVKKAYDRFDLGFKKQYVLPTLHSTELFEELEYQPQGAIPYDEIRDSGVVACGERKFFQSEDLLTGKYEEVKFTYGDVVTRYLKRTGKNREIRTIFEGQVMIFSSFDRIKTSFGQVQIFEREFLSDLRGRTARQEIQTEDAAFNQRFSVFADDPHNAFYILTPRMMEQITRFADAVGEQISITFTGPFLYVAIHRTRSLFNGYVDKPIGEQRQDILEDAELLRQAGDLLIIEMASLSL